MKQAGVTEEPQIQFLNESAKGAVQFSYLCNPYINFIAMLQTPA